MFINFVDMEFLIKQGGGNSMEVDIGFIPQMELLASHPSVPAVDMGADIGEFPLAVSTQNTVHNSMWYTK